MPEFVTTNVTITGDIQVTVPESPRFMTTFVPLEQDDWFEDEVDFVRFFVKPGMKVLDIGANYGCYALMRAKIIGGAGKIWAFVPTKMTAACLRKSILANKFHSIDLVQAGLSDRCGKATFFTSPNAELNSLSRGVFDDNTHETIRLLTLDHCKDEYQWGDIDFMKLNVEGEECNILRGGAKTLSSLSPLIMFELKHGESINLPLIE
ncbi:MAG: FkbM family methyltransferase [Gammaproteobacteria bacterium]|nr:FkbM family methyltransferase [Gammaproteobacteria bacterium]